MVDCLPTITLVNGLSQSLGAVGLNMPQAPKPARISAPATTLGSTARSGRGAPSSVPVGEGWRNAATVRLFAKVYALSSSRRDAMSLSVSRVSPRGTGFASPPPVPDPGCRTALPDRPPTMPADHGRLRGG